MAPSSSQAQDSHYVLVPARFDYAVVFGIAVQAWETGYPTLEAARDAGLARCEKTLHTGTIPPFYPKCRSTERYPPYNRDTPSHGTAVWGYGFWWSYPSGGGSSNAGRVSVDCPPGTRVFLYAPDVYDHPPVCYINKTEVNPQKNIEPKQCVGNPCDPGSGNKLQREIIYTGNTQTSFQYILTYNSLLISNAGHGSRWRSNYHRELLPFYANNVSYLAATRASGKVLSFHLQNGAWVAEIDVTDQLNELKDEEGVRTGWQYVSVEDHVTEYYSPDGKLLTLHKLNGETYTYTYSDALTPASIAPRPGLLIRLTNQYGRELQFTYDAYARIYQMKDPAEATYIFEYDSNSDLTSVTFPDNSVRHYIYNEPANISNASARHALTGIVDENGGRYATFKYNSSGLAISTEHAGALNKYTLSYTIRNGNIGSTKVVDPLGSERTYTYKAILGVNYPTGISQPAANGSAAASQGLTYDAQGNVTSRTDFNGVATTYQYDLARNLETLRVEASGTSAARTITTTWHPAYRLPTQVAEPLRITINSYDTKGNLLSRSIQATGDANGAQGFAATAIGEPRIWNYTYNDYGQILTADGPVAGEADKTIYAYDEMGNLTTLTNAKGNVTTLGNYDANGRVGRITDPNGLVTDLTYSPRGWLISRVVAGESTNYEYDGVGQMKKVTMPDGSFISYTYDDAHRLTDIQDSLGNRITYTLDAMGNRISEKVKDPAGTLTRQVTRLYDALNRLQQITGEVQ